MSFLSLKVSSVFKFQIKLLSCGDQIVHTTTEFPLRLLFVSFFLMEIKRKNAMEMKNLYKHSSYLFPNVDFFHNSVW